MDRSCPKCRDVQLRTPEGRATRLLRCPGCKGTWLPRNEARLEAVAELFSNESTIRPAEMTDGQAGLCPLGHGILIRARVEMDQPFYLERCARCSGVWLDKGEWNLLAQGHLLDNMDLLWDSAWRFRNRRLRAEVEYKDRLQRDLGIAGVEALELLTTVLSNKSPSIRLATLAHLRETVEAGV